MEPIGVSCKCITYGRTEYIIESIESFLRQEYEGESELVIVNDYPLQTLVFDHPKVRIYNMPETFSTIGEKENFAVSLCKYDTIAVWDDDDLALPNHLSNINKYFPGHDLLHWNTGILLVSNKIASIGNCGNSGIVYSKQIWEKVGKHELENAGYDTTFVVKVQKAGGKIARVIMPDEEASWMYSWGNGSYHMSGQGADVPDRENVLVRHGRHIEMLRQQGKIPTGIVNLEPKWNRDYIEMHRQFVSALKITEATYGGKDVTDVVSKMIIDNKLSLHVSNATFGDPMPNVVKYLDVKYSQGGIEKYISLIEGSMCVLPVEQKKTIRNNGVSPKVKFIIPFPDSPYYLWQVLVQIMNFRKMGYEQDAIYPVSYFKGKPSEILLRLANSPEIKANFYLYPAEERTNRTYSAANKPWLMGKFFEQFPEEKGVFNYLDPDVVFTKPMDFEPFIHDDKWYGSSTKGYTGITYIKSKAEQLLVDLCRIAEVSVEQVEANDHNSIGAQYFIKNCTADFWFDIARKATVAFKHMNDTATIYKKPEDPYPVQAWASEMYFTQYEMIKRGIEPVASELMKFSGANHHISDWEAKPYFHNAMVPKENGRDFCKISYQTSPFRKEINVSPDSISSKYVELIKETEIEFADLIWD